MSPARRVRAHVFVCALAGVARAQEAGPAPLAELVRELIESNASIRAAQYRVDAASKRPSQVSALPDPKLSITNFGVGHPLSRLGASDFAYQSFGFSQEIPYPGKLALASEQARREAEAERETYRSVVLEATAQLKGAYFDWFAAWKAAAITRQNRDLLERIEQIARARYSTGKGLQQDILKAQLDQSALVQQLELLGQREATARARIISLLGRQRPLHHPEEVRLSPLTVTLEDLLALAGEQAPRLRSRRAMIDSRSVAIERSKRDYRPDFGFSFQWQKNGAPFRDYYMATAELRVPLYFWRKQRMGVEESVARFREAREEYESSLQDVVFQVKDLYFTATTAARLVELYRAGIIPQASLALESSMAGYEAGQSDFQALMSNFISVLSYETRYWEEITRHEQALAQLEALVDTPLVRR